MTVASTPNSDSVRTSRSAVFALASPFVAGPAGDARSSVRSGSRYSGCSDDVSKTDSTLSSSGSGSSTSSADSSECAEVPTTSGYASAPSSRRCCVTIGAARCSGTSTSSSVCVSLDGHSNARRAPEPARFTTCPVRRRIAPVEAPVTSRRPPRSTAPPMIAAPVWPISAASVPPIAIPMKPPESLPSSVMSPRKLTPTPSRNGRTSRRSLRASSSPPRPRSATGRTYAASPMISVSTSASHEPTAPPSSPR